MSTEKRGRVGITKIAMGQRGAGMIRITRTHLGEIGDDETLDSVTAMCDFGGGDYALRYIPPRLHIFRVIEREVSA